MYAESSLLLGHSGRSIAVVYNGGWLYDSVSTICGNLITVFVGDGVSLGFGHWFFRQ